MSYTDKLVSVLTGLSRNQLRRLSKKEIVVPEIRRNRPPIYSYRDLVALRSIAFLRAHTSLQKLGKTFENLNMLELVAHPSTYRFGTDGKTIIVDTGDEVMDMYQRPGQRSFFTFEQITKPFTGYRDRDVPDLFHPHEEIELMPGRVGGQPTIEGTRVQSEAIAALVDYETIWPEDIPEHFPHITAEQAENAVAFHRRVQEVA